MEGVDKSHTIYSKIAYPCRVVKMQNIRNRSTPNHTGFSISALFVFSTFVPLLCLAQNWYGSAFSEFSRYNVILEREPFGVIPKGLSAEELALLAAKGSVDSAVPDEKSIAKQIRLMSITKYNGLPAAGFWDSESKRSYLLIEGQSIMDFTLVKVDTRANKIILSKGDITEEISMSFAKGQPAEFVESANPEFLTVLNVVAKATPRTPVNAVDDLNKSAIAQTALPQPNILGVSPDLVAAATVATGDGDEKISFRELHRLRVEQSRMTAANEKRKREEVELQIATHDAAMQEARENLLETAKLEEQAKRALVIQSIKEGKITEVNIELTSEEARELSAAGFEVPSTVPTDTPDVLPESGGE